MLSGGTRKGSPGEAVSWALLLLTRNFEADGLYLGGPFKGAIPAAILK